jgi:hypothetical protein
MRFSRHPQSCSDFKKTVYVLFAITRQAAAAWESASAGGREFYASLRHPAYSEFNNRWAPQKAGKSK